MPVPESIFGSTVVPGIANTFTTVYTAPVGSAYLVELDICNTLETGFLVDVRIHDASQGVDAYFIKNTPVPIGSTLQAVFGQKIVLREGDYVEVKSTSPDPAFDVSVSFIEDINITP